MLITRGSLVRGQPDPPASSAWREARSDRVVSSRRQARQANGGLAQLGEHLLCKQRVVGSNPSSSTNELPARDRKQKTLVLEARVCRGMRSVLWTGSLTNRKKSGSMPDKRGMFPGCIASTSSIARPRLGPEGPRIRSYRVKRISACGGCLGDYRRRRT